MPLHDFMCPAGHVTEAFVEHGVDAVHCDWCAAVAHKAFLTPPMGFVQPDVCYDSPVDGRAITSMQARREDLARNNCVAYDPEMKKDAERRRKESDAKLEQAIDQTVDREIALMPARKREKLEAELQGGLTVSPERMTAPAKPIQTTLNG